MKTQAVEKSVIDKKTIVSIIDFLMLFRIIPFYLINLYQRRLYFLVINMGSVANKPAQKSNAIWIKILLLCFIFKFIAGMDIKTKNNMQDDSTK